MVWIKKETAFFTFLSFISMIEKAKGIRMPHLCPEDSVYVPEDKKCYSFHGFNKFYNNTRKQPFDARLDCTLAEIRSKAAQDVIAAAIQARKCDINSMNAPFVHVGLENVGKSVYFRYLTDPAGAAFLANDTTRYQGWCGSEPQYFYKGKPSRCVALSTIASNQFCWDDIECYNNPNYPYICQHTLPKEPTRDDLNIQDLSCGEGWTYSHSAGRCYRKFSPATWVAAREQCQMHGARLQVLADPWLDHFIELTRRKCSGTPPFWTGLYSMTSDPASLGVPTWVTGHVYTGIKNTVNTPITGAVKAADHCYTIHIGVSPYEMSSHACNNQSITFHFSCQKVAGIARSQTARTSHITTQQDMCYSPLVNPRRVDLLPSITRCIATCSNAQWCQGACFDPLQKECRLYDVTCESTGGLCGVELGVTLVEMGHLES